jgi:membrane-bound metal-dependent hydrolase YbcI (DUF457 family)
MYFFFHLLTGIILGLLIGELLHDRRWIIPCALGSVLPDLIDKPLGLLVFGSSIGGSGRAWSHGILLLIVVLAVGTWIWKYRGSPVVLGAGIGIFSHQILDLMWRQPANWLYPFLGPLRGKMPLDRFFLLLRRELYNPSEWALLALIILGAGLYLRRDRTGTWVRNHSSAVRTVLGCCAFLLLVYSGIVLSAGIFRLPIPVFPSSRREGYIIGGIVIALAAYLVWRWQRSLPVDKHSRKE